MKETKTTFYFGGGGEYVSNIPSGQVRYFRKPRVSIAISA